MKTMRQYLRFRAVCLVVLALSISSPSLLVAGRGDKLGTAGGSELMIPVGARSIGLSGAMTSSIEGVEAIYYNPAGLAWGNHGPSVMFSHMSYLADIGVNYVAVGTSFAGLGTLGMSIKSLAIGEIPITTEQQPDGTGAIATPTFVTIGATYANNLSDRIAVGITGNLVTERMERVSASVVAFSVGIQYHGIAGLGGIDLGVAVKNIGPQMQYGGPGMLRTGQLSDVTRPSSFYDVTAASFELPSTMEIGVGYRHAMGESDEVSLNGTFQNNNFLDDQYRLGLEYNYHKLLFGRAGYNYAAKTSDADNIFSGSYGWSMGFGVRTDVGDMSLGFDYAYRAVQYFSGNQVFTLTIGF